MSVVSLAPDPLLTARHETAPGVRPDADQTPDGSLTAAPPSARGHGHDLHRPHAQENAKRKDGGTGKDVAAVHGSEDERDGDEAAAQQRAAAYARLLMQNQVQQPDQQQPEQQQFQPQMHLQLAGSGATAASGEKRERGERGGVERAAAADGGRVERVTLCSQCA